MKRLILFFVTLALLIFLIFPLGEKGVIFLGILFFVSCGFLIGPFLLAPAIFCWLMFLLTGPNDPLSHSLLLVSIFLTVLSGGGIWFLSYLEADKEDRRRSVPRRFFESIKDRKKIIVFCVFLGCPLCWFSQPPIRRAIIQIEVQMWFVEKTNWWVGVSARAWDYIDERGAETIKEIRRDLRIKEIKKDFQDRFHEWESWKERRKEKGAWTFSLAEVRSHSDTTCVHHLLRDWAVHGPGELNDPIIRKLNTDLGTKLVSMLRRGEKFPPDDKLREEILRCDILVEGDAVVPMLKALQYPYDSNGGIAPEELGTTRSELDSLLLLRERK